MKKIGCFIVLLCNLFVLQAQDLKSLFIELPDSLSPLLTKVNREDFGDFLDSNMKAQVKNRFGKISEMLKLTDNYLELQLTKVSKVEMKLLPVNDSTQVVCVVQTYQGPVEDSKVSFYDTNWRRLKADDYLMIPKETEFYKGVDTEEQRDSLDALKRYADVYLLKAKLTEKNSTISFSYTTPDYLDKEIAKKLKPFLRSAPICLEWKDGKFVK